jgi:hypothetical protein
MARSLPPRTWRRGFAEPSTHVDAAWADTAHSITEKGDQGHHDPGGPSVEQCTSDFRNSVDGQTTLRYWPALYSGTESPGGRPDWWKADSEVDVLICGGT